jgi:mono/diheme cytochrome c family protein
VRRWRPLRLGLWAVLLTPLVMAGNPGYVKDPRWVAPPEAAARSSPVAPGEGSIGGGRKLFMRNCAECHGMEGRGLGRAADLADPAVQGQSDGALFWKITNGNLPRRMPSFSRLPESQRWQLVLFLRTLRAEPGPG